MSEIKEHFKIFFKTIGKKKKSNKKRKREESSSEEDEPLLRLKI